MASTPRPDFFLSIPKQQLASLPPAKFGGRIVVVDSRELALPALEHLRNAGLIGFDTETRPSFKKGTLNEVSLMQLSDHDVCYLFRINRIGFFPELISFLEDDTVTKVGLSVHDDFHNLHRLASFEPRGFIDLQGFVKQFRIADNSLSRIFAILFGQRISKGQRLTNWEAEHLSEAQQAYASLDAFACIKIYDCLHSGKFIPADSPYIQYSETDPASDDQSSSRALKQ